MLGAGLTRKLLAALLFSALGTAIADDQKTTTVPSSPGTGVLKEALESYRKGFFEQAIAKYNEVLKADPQSSEAAAGIVRCYLKQDKVHEAAEILKKALDAKPSDLDLKVAQGELFFRQGKISDAEKLFVEVVNSGHRAPRAYLGIARISSAIAMYAREHNMIVRAHEIDPSDPEIQKEWMYTLSRAERIKFLDSYLAEPNADDADARRSLGEYLEFLKAAQARPQGTCQLTSDVTSTETDLLPFLSDSQHLRGFGLPVIVNGKKSKLLFDTGAGGITINRNLANKAGLQRISDIHVGGVGDKGDLRGYIAYADSIRIGNLEFHHCPIEVVDKRSVVEDEGLIGATVFSKYLIEIDFPKWKLRLSELPRRPGEASSKTSLLTGEDEGDADSDSKTSSDTHKAPENPPPPKYFDRYIAPEMASYTRVFRFGHMLLVPTKINDVPGKLFLIDSGAFNNTITPDAAREVTKVHGSDDYMVKGVSGSVKKVYETGEVNLEFGHLRQKMEDMVAFDLSNISRDVGTEISGTLGFAMLNLLTIRLDYRDALVTFEYTPDPRRR